MVIALEAGRHLEAMPDELFDMWIRPEIENRGWPFGGNEKTVSDPAWAKYLRNLGPHFWSRVRWSRVIQSFAEAALEDRAIVLAHQLAAVGRKFAETGVAEPTLVKNSPQRVAALARIIAASGELPKPLVCLVQGSEWWLMDGHHRLAALFMLGKQDTVQFDTWLGTHDL